MESLLKNLQNNSPTRGSRSLRVEAEGETLSVTAIDVLKRQLAGCWNIPAGTRDAHNLVVVVRAEIGPDGVAIRAKILPQKSSSQNLFYRVAAEAALRALRHPSCTSLKLPPHQYSLWKILEITFNPKDMR